jgi:protein SCO1/2
MTLATFKAIRQGLDSGAGPKPRFLFVSVDPGRDTPERLAQYVRWFDPAFIGATGDEAQLRALVAQLGLLYARVDGQSSALGYLMDHSASIVLIDPLGRLAAVFSAPHDAQRMAADFLTIADRRPT